jgi:hypothetical protein
MRSAETQVGERNSRFGTYRLLSETGSLSDSDSFLRNGTSESRDNSLTNCPRDECNLTH